MKIFEMKISSEAVSFEVLGWTGDTFEQYDYVVAVATVKAATGQLCKRLRRAKSM